MYLLTQLCLFHIYPGEKNLYIQLLGPEHTQMKSVYILPGFHDGSAGKEFTCIARDAGDVCVAKIPWRRKWQPTPVFLPGKSHWTEELGGLQSMKSQTVRYNQAHEHIHFASRGVESILVYTHTNSMLESALSFCTWDLRCFSPKLGLPPHDRIWTLKRIWIQGQCLTLHLYILQCTKWHWFYTEYPNKVLINRPSSYHDLQALQFCSPPSPFQFPLP